MRLIEATDLSKDWDGSPLFQGASFCIDEGDKIGLVGANGSGKSSLLGILSGLDEDFRGRLARKPGLRVGFAAQHFEAAPGLSCAQVLARPALALEPGLERAGEALGLLQGQALEKALEAYGALRTEYERFGAEEARDKASRLLDRLGLPGAGEKEAQRLSGGEKNVLSLAMALMGDPELLILDEPGNHLDFEGLSWLEDFVRGERRAVVMVSHNRWLLDRSVDSILELEGRRITRYAGGFSSYRIEKLKRAAGQGRDWEADRRRIERLEALVRRFAEIARSRPDPAWGKRLRARRSQLEREKSQAALRPELGSGRINVSFRASESKADFALVVRDYSRAFGERLLFEAAGLDLLVGERAALVGRNGSGKTTFLRDLVAAEGSTEGGPIRVGPSMRVGYCAQEAEVLDPRRTVGQEFRDLGLKDREIEAALRSYLFAQGILDRPIGELSGGEVKRLEIARACMIGANFLVLDEPTNHLDIEGREALEEALSDFPGSILLVSHDRWFLEKVADRIILLEDGGFQPYEGPFSEYWRDRGLSSSASRPGQGGPRGLEDRAASMAKEKKAGSSKAVSPNAARAKVLEGRIAEAEARVAGLERESAGAIAGRDFAKGGRLAEEAQGLRRQIDRLYEEWASLG